MATGRRALGRGLAELIPVGGDGAPESEAAAIHIGVDRLRPNPRQPRTNFESSALEDLAQSILSNGVLQPLLVRPVSDGGYEIVAGERRYRAALRAGLTSVPVVVREYSDADALAMALVENLVREDIGPLESARGIKRLIGEFGWSQEETGRRLAKSRPAISNVLRLLELPPSIQAGLEKGHISEGHARALLGDRAHREDPAFVRRQERVFRRIVDAGINVRDAEREMKGTVPSAEPANSPDVSRETSSARHKRSADTERRAIEDRLRTALGARVRLSGDLQKGRIEVDYYSSSELDSLLEAICGASPVRASGPVAHDR